MVWFIFGRREPSNRTGELTKTRDALLMVVTIEFQMNIGEHHCRSLPKPCSVFSHLKLTKMPTLPTHGIHCFPRRNMCGLLVFRIFPTKDFRLMSVANITQFEASFKKMDGELCLKICLCETRTNPKGKMQYVYMTPTDLDQRKQTVGVKTPQSAFRRDKPITCRLSAWHERFDFAGKASTLFFF